MKLTQENYYQHDTSWKYMSVSLFKDFLNCEAQALAKLKEEWQPVSDPTALLLGNYVHSYFESKEAHKKFLEDNKKSLFKYGNPEKGIKKDFVKGDEMIKVLDEDEAFKNIYVSGKKEVIVTGNIFGHKWKGKIDSLVLDKAYFCDIKTNQDLHKKHWSEDLNRYTNFISAYGYYMQMAVYRELIKQTFNVECQPFIFGVSKQTPPDHEAYSFNSPDAQYYMNGSLELIEKNQDHIFEVMNGETEPKRCGVCEYCRQTKKITAFIDANDIEIY